MTLTIGFSLLLFAAVFALVVAFWHRSRTSQDTLVLRLRELRERAVASGNTFVEERPPLLLDLIARLGGFLPANEGRDAMRTGLVRAGYRDPKAVYVLLGAKVVCAVLLPLLWIGFAYTTARPTSVLVRGAFLCAIGGFYLPTVFIAMRKSRRRQSIVSALPDALDLLVVCVEAGLGIGAAIQRVADEMKATSPELSEEWSLVHQEMQAGVSRTDAMRGMATRTGIDELYALVAMLIQTDRLGNGVATALRAHADSMRTRRRQRAEKLARQAAVKMTFPLVFLILPALLVTILGPAAIVLVKSLINGGE
jgi:tight adherence protein C